MGVKFILPTNHCFLMIYSANVKFNSNKQQYNRRNTHNKSIFMFFLTELTTDKP
jgi:hypothetical protein